MKSKKFTLRHLYFLFFLIIPWTSCDDKDKFEPNQEEKVVVSTEKVTAVTKNEAVLSGRVSNKGGEAMTENGICYSKQSKPTVSDEKVLNTKDLDTGAFVLHVQNLNPSTTYYYRAFVTNKSGTSYGEALSFTTASGYVSKLETEAATKITRVSAVLGGKITDDGGYTVTSKGFCYSNTTPYPTIANDRLPVDTQSTSFKADLTKLTAGTTYYVRAYATSSVGTGYGEIVSFTTASPILASGISTAAAGSVTYSSALVGGTILDDNGAAVIVRGICYSSSNSTPTLNNGKVLNIGTGIGSFSAHLTELTANKTYYVRAFATNSSGTAYGPVVSFKTLMPELPSNVTTRVPTHITRNSAVSGGDIGYDGGGTITARGVIYSPSATLPTLTNGTVVSDDLKEADFSVGLFELRYNTTYYVRAYATNEAGTTYGNVHTFKTLLPDLPSGLKTVAASNISKNSAYVSGNINSTGGGIISPRGIVYSSTNSSPILGDGTVVTLGTGIGNFGTTLTGLTPSTTYYARIYATNEAGTTYGNVISFKTLSPYSIPTGVTTPSATNISKTSVTLNGYVENDGGSPITERGFLYSTDILKPPFQGAGKLVASGTSVGAFSANLNPQGGTFYSVVAYAKNAYGVSYGDIIWVSIP